MNRSDHTDPAGHAPAESFAMTAPERRASVALAAVYATRMLGLFLVLPVLAVHAAGMPGGGDARLVGWALGIYGLTQALLQLPFGLASDRFGRKPVIYFGLLVFAAGSMMAAVADTLPMLVAARALQGAGAVSAAVSALLADLTRDSQRTKAMAMVGASIGVSFGISLIAAPWLYGLVGMGGLFALTAACALAGIALVRLAVPDPAPGADAAPVRFADVLREPDLLRLDLGIFTLHAVQVALFVVVPGWLVSRAGLPLAEHWKIYLPVMIVSFLLMVPPIIWAEKRGRMRGVFLAAIVVLVVAAGGLSFGPEGLGVIGGLLLAFFWGFNVLEACLPSMVSRLAPVAAKGAALGVYNTAQSLGLFAGGAIGGWILSRADGAAVFIACAMVLVLWLLVAIGHRRWPQRGGAAPVAQASAS
ncbi:MAG: MFS transporter [Burkholderiaceae bacterium]|nr:MFS transporter [Burkholderiaceae bacterium]